MFHMVSSTIRDKVWTLALIKTHRKGEAVYPVKLADELDLSERTVRDCLNVMSDNGFIIRATSPDGESRYLASDSI